MVLSRMAVAGRAAVVGLASSLYLSHQHGQEAASWTVRAEAVAQGEQRMKLPRVYFIIR